jgi:hypothetical protein
MTEYSTGVTHGDEGVTEVSWQVAVSYGGRDDVRRRMLIGDRSGDDRALRAFVVRSRWMCPTRATTWPESTELPKDHLRSVHEIGKYVDRLLPGDSAHAQKQQILIDISE